MGQVSRRHQINNADAIYSLFAKAAASDLENFLARLSLVFLRISHLSSSSIKSSSHANMVLGVSDRAFQDYQGISSRSFAAIIPVIQQFGNGLCLGFTQNG